LAFSKSFRVSLLLQKSARGHLPHQFQSSTILLLHDLFSLTRYQCHHLSRNSDE
jgi:hypothetical protein